MRKGSHHSDATKEKMRLAHRGENNHRWKGGKFIGTQGYVHVLKEDGKYIREHRLIAKEVLGRDLRPDEIVHHIDGNKTNNDKDNLLICTQGFHLWLDRRMAQLYRERYGSEC